jgi:hypothetical protein
MQDNSLELARKLMVKKFELIIYPGLLSLISDLAKFHQWDY